MAPGRKAGGSAEWVMVRLRLSSDALRMLNEMADVRGGGPSVRNVVLEEALRLWHDQDPLLARRKRRTKPAEGT